MRIMIRPSEQAPGSGRLTAIDLAEGVADEGHDVLVVASPGPVADLARDRGLDVRPAPARRLSIDARSARFVACLADEFRADIVHNYEWPSAVEWALHGSRATGAASVTTILSTAVPRFLPDDGTLVVGTRALAEAETSRRARVRLIEPFVDTIADRPSRWASDRQGTRSRLGLSADDAVIALVGDLGGAALAGALQAVEAVERLSARARVRLLVASDGPIAGAVASAAAAVNARRGSTVVEVRSGVADLRPLYDAADIALGSGVSVLRAMAFRTPAVVLGTGGFWAVVDEEAAEGLALNGWTGDGGGGALQLERILTGLLSDADGAARLAGFGHTLVEEHFSLDDAVEALLEVYADAVTQRSVALAPSARLLLNARAAWDAGRFRVAADVDRRHSRGAA